MKGVGEGWCPGGRGKRWLQKGGSSSDQLSPMMPRDGLSKCSELFIRGQERAVGGAKA